MNLPLDLGVLFALLCAFGTNLAFLLKHRGAKAAPPVDVRRPGRSAAGLFRSRWQEIAARLHLSIKTIETHVSNVLRKLQLTNRNELTRWAAQRRMI